MASIARAKRLGWNEGSTGNVTRVDILDPYDYTDDDLHGEYVERFVANERVGPYTQYIVDGQLADPATVTIVSRDSGGRDTGSQPATLLSSGGAEGDAGH